MGSMNELYPNKGARNANPSSTTVLGAAACGFESFIARQGGSSRHVLQRAHLATDAPFLPSKRISLSRFLTAIDQAAACTGNTNFGLWYGEQFSPESLGPWGYVGLASSTLGEALENMVRYFPAFQQGSRLQLKFQQNTVALEYQLCDGAILSRRQDAELTIGILKNVMTRSLGLRWKPHSVCFRHPMPARPQEHNGVFRTDVRFGQTCNSIEMKQSDLAARMPQADPYLLQTIKDFLSILEKSGQAPLSVSNQVRDQIASLLHAGRPTLPTVADRMNLPPWTLQRQLKEEQETFASLLDDVRRELATNYLEEAAASLAETAEMLGYSELSSFSHAFHRWYGIAPSHWKDSRSDLMLQGN